MSWTPVVAGSLGVSLGGVLGDRVLKRAGSAARVWVLILGQAIAAPMALAVLFAPVGHVMLRTNREWSTHGLSSVHACNLPQHRRHVLC